MGHRSWRGLGGGPQQRLQSRSTRYMPGPALEQKLSPVAALQCEPSHGGGANQWCCLGHLLAGRTSGLRQRWTVWGRRYRNMYADDTASQQRTALDSREREEASRGIGCLWRWLLSAGRDLDSRYFTLRLLLSITHLLSLEAKSRREKPEQAINALSPPLRRLALERTTKTLALSTSSLLSRQWRQSMEPNDRVSSSCLSLCVRCSEPDRGSLLKRNC